jgi:hypothetical protein
LPGVRSGTFPFQSKAASTGHEPSRALPCLHSTGRRWLAPADAGRLLALYPLTGTQLQRSTGRVFFTRAG